MRIALCSDEPYPVHDVVQAELVRRGHEVRAFGAVATGHDEPWAEVAEAAALAVASGDCDEGIFFCWTGTGISIAANKVAGIRAATVHDVTSARMSRAHNDANVMCIGERFVGEQTAIDALDAFMTGEFEGGRHAGRVAKINDLDC